LVQRSIRINQPDIAILSFADYCTDIELRNRLEDLAKFGVPVLGMQFGPDAKDFVPAKEVW